MGEIINLRLARKRKHRAQLEATADQNRTIHGRTKAERLVQEAEKQRAATQHEAHRREKADDTDSET